MKNLILILCIMATFSCCKKDDDTPTTPVEQLPPATQTGANTFGCLLDGEVFLPKGGTNPLDCVYQFVDGGYYFALQANKRNDNNNLIGITISTDDLELQNANTYSLLEKEPNNAYGGLYSNLNFNYTSQSHTGELTITKLDETNQIVSGTFWFDVEDGDGVVHQIREGRFDMQYTI